MAWLVRSGTEAQYFDYWYVLDRILTEDGGLDLAGLFTTHNIHPMVLPGSIYWLSARLLGGSNVTLGYLVVLMGALQVAILGWWGLRTLTSGARQAVLLLVAAFLLLSPAGAWNFLEAMSGAAWLPANILVLLASWALVRDRRGAAIALGLLASLAYGTGLLVWPVLCLLAAVRETSLRESARSAGPLALVGGVVAILYALAPKGDDALVDNGVVMIGRDSPQTVLSGLGFIFTSNETLSAVLGVLGIVGGVILGRRVRAVGGPAVVWIGAWAYGLSAFALMSLGRTDAFQRSGTEQFSRYASLSALFWVSILAMALVVVPRVQPAALIGACAIVASTLSGQHYIDQQRATWPSQERLAVAMRIGVTDGSRIQVFAVFPDLLERLRRIGHYPFGKQFVPDCGALWTTLDLDEVEPPSSGEGRSRTTVKRSLLVRDTVELTSAPVADLEKIGCVAVVDRRGSVVGTGFTNAARDEVLALGLVKAGGHRLLVASGPDGQWRWLGRDP